MGINNHRYYHDHNGGQGGDTILLKPLRTLWDLHKYGVGSPPEEWRGWTGTTSAGTALTFYCPLSLQSGEGCGGGWGDSRCHFTMECTVTSLNIYLFKYLAKYIYDGPGSFSEYNKKWSRKQLLNLFFETFSITWTKCDFISTFQASKFLHLYYYE